MVTALVCFSLSMCAQDATKTYHEVELNFIHEGDSIFGKLIVPNQKSKEKLPVIVFVHGSGPEDYSSSGNYNYLWQEFAKVGFASYSWNKPGVGKSQGQWYEQTVSRRAGEVMAAMNKLNTIDFVDHTKIGLWGISQAGWVMPLVATEVKPAFVISVASPVTTVIDQELYRVKSEMKVDGYLPEDIDKAIWYTNALKRLADEGKPYSRFAELQNDIDNYKWSQVVIRGDEMVYNYIKVILQEDKAPSISNYHCPLLAIWGENDLMVPPVISSDFFKKKMKEINNTNATVKVIAKADHTLTFNLSGKRNETIARREQFKDNPELIFAPGAVPIMVTWLKELYH